MSLRSIGSSSPPRADLAFRIGIVGHRPNRLPKEKEKIDALRQVLRSVLEEVKAEVLHHAGLSAAEPQYSDNPPVLRAVSPLAEGTDRMFAEEALDLGYGLCAPMPFSQDEFEQDFAPPHALEADSCNRFRGILQRAREGAGLTTFELDGERSAPGEAYSAAGRVVLNQSDLLVAVWDGGKPAGVGGTVETLQDAVRYHVPVLWIDALDPGAWQMLWVPEDLACLESKERCVPNAARQIKAAAAGNSIAETVRQIVLHEIALPAEPSDPHRPPTTQSRAPQYFREHKPCCNLAFSWKLFRDAAGSGTFRRPKIAVADFETQIRGEWPTRDDTGSPSTVPGAIAAPTAHRHEPSEVEDWVNRRLRPHYAWSDKRGDLYADAYRSAYVLTYLLSAMAVFVALLPMAAGWEGARLLACVATELAMLLLIVFLLGFGWRRQWHERWMEYRLLAELIRQLRFLIPMGGGRPFPRVPTHLGVYGNLTQTWMYWHMRAIARATGIPQAKVNRTYVLDSLDYLAKVVGVTRGGQLTFHMDTEKRSENIAHRLHWASAIFFSLTIGSILLHFVLDLSESWRPLHWLHDHLSSAYREGLQGWLVLASATLPALGAALAGIKNQGEFARLARRSAAMADGFKRFAEQIEALQSAGSSTVNAPKLSQVGSLAGKIADVMVEEVSDWRVFFIDRPQTAA
jgi:hypothetical protein